jgi:hypothetical protein
MTPVFADVASPWSMVTLAFSPIIILIEAGGFSFYARFVLKRDVGFGRVLAWVAVANIATSVVGSFYVPNLYVYLVRNLVAISIAFVGSTFIEGAIYAVAFQRDKIGVGHLLAISAIGNLVTHALIFAVWMQPVNAVDAAFRGDVPRLQLALKLGADVNTGFPLHTAASRGSIAAARVLLDAGADVNAVRDGRTPLALVVADRPYLRDLVVLLVERGASVDNGILDRIAQTGDDELIRRVEEALKARGHPTRVGSNP